MKHKKRPFGTSYIFYKFRKSWVHSGNRPWESADIDLQRCELFPDMTRPLQPYQNRWSILLEWQKPLWAPHLWERSHFRDSCFRFGSRTNQKIRLYTQPFYSLLLYTYFAHCFKMLNNWNHEIITIPSFKSLSFPSSSLITITLGSASGLGKVVRKLYWISNVCITQPLLTFESWFLCLGLQGCVLSITGLTPTAVLSLTFRGRIPCITGLLLLCLSAATGILV